MKVGEFWWSSAQNLYRIDQMDGYYITECTLIEAPDGAHPDYPVGSVFTGKYRQGAFIERDNFRSAVYQRHLDKELTSSYPDEEIKGDMNGESK